MLSAPTNSGIVSAISLCLKKHLSFAAYKLPGKPGISLVIQKDRRIDTVENIAEISATGGFILAPFKPGIIAKRMVIRPDIFCSQNVTPEQMQQIQAIAESSETDSAGHEHASTPQDDFIRQANSIIDAEKKGEYGKIVLSRVKCIEGDYADRLNTIFTLLCNSYNNAFVYVFNISGHCWIGATPEPLLCSRGELLTTVSLAGTKAMSQVNVALSSWNEKERMEQEYVTRQIEGVLAEFNVSNISKNGPLIKQAGSLLHLCTEFSFPPKQIQARLSEFIDALHPTSAVCGIPKQKAMHFITAAEKHDREFYAGYLGPVGLSGYIQLYVNLRCMKIQKNSAALFVGGGITADSIAAGEWEETEMKAETMLAILRKVH